jgi:4'-phosphopantetheinyl transferase
MQPHSAVANMSSLLSREEREAANRSVSPMTFRRFTVRRAARRLILSRYAHCPAHALIFDSRSCGKPLLPKQRGLHFSCSASGELALIGVTNGRRVGIDVERVQPVPDAVEIASRFFARRESNAVVRAPASGRSPLFLSLWTCKEAWIKATGAGFSRSLDSFEVDCFPATRLRRVDGDYRESHRWLIQRFRPAPGFIGAVAIEIAN